jgi:hypothetical protein
MPPEPAMPPEATMPPPEWVGTFPPALVPPTPAVIPVPPPVPMPAPPAPSSGKDISSFSHAQKKNATGQTSSIQALRCERLIVVSAGQAGAVAVALVTQSFDWSCPGFAPWSQRQ